MRALLLAGESGNLPHPGEAADKLDEGGRAPFLGSLLGGSGPGCGSRSPPLAEGAAHDLRRCGHRQGGPRDRRRRRDGGRGRKAHEVQELGGRLREVHSVAGVRRRVGGRGLRRHGGHRPLLEGLLRLPDGRGLPRVRRQPHAGARDAQAQEPVRREERPHRLLAHSRDAAPGRLRRDEAGHRRGAGAQAAHPLPPGAQAGARRREDPGHMRARRLLPGIRGAVLRHGRPR